MVKAFKIFFARFNYVDFLIQKRENLSLLNKFVANIPFFKEF